MTSSFTLPGDEALYDAEGGRKYICAIEHRRFLDAANRAEPATRAFCRLLAFTGCRISEALSLTPARLDDGTQRVIFLTLKRRKRVFRSVPIPRALMSELHGLCAGHAPDAPLWSWTRQTAWRHVKAAMAMAGIAGSQATPKGLRHGFGVANAEHNVPPALTRRWMGHASLETTAIYQQVMGREELAFARRIWKHDGRER